MPFRRAGQAAARQAASHSKVCAHDSFWPLFLSVAHNCICMVKCWEEGFQTENHIVWGASLAAAGHAPLLDCLQCFCRSHFSL